MKVTAPCRAESSARIREIVGQIETEPKPSNPIELTIHPKRHKETQGTGRPRHEETHGEQERATKERRIRQTTSQ